MESVELSLTNMETPFSDDGLENGDDFSVDDLLDFSNDDDVFAEDGAESNIQRKKGGELSVSSNDETTLNRSNDYLLLHRACELAVPTDDLAELEWLSNFVDDSSFTPYSAPTNKPVWLTGDRRQTLTPVNVEFCFKPSLPVKFRTKRPRTGDNLWSPSLTDSSSSSSSSSGNSSPLWLSGAEFLDEKAVKSQKKMEKKKQLTSTTTLEEVQTQTRRCSHCGVLAGPLGAKTLCNACGVRFKSDRLLPEYRPACCPTFSSELHSNHHRKVVEMRQKKGTSRDAELTGMNQPVQAV